MNNDGRKPIQCLDVDDHDMDKEEEDEEDEGIATGSLLKVQKVTDNKVAVAMSQIDEDEEMERSDWNNLAMNIPSAADFDKNSRQLSFKSGHSAFANIETQSKKIAESKLTPCHPLKEISPGLRQKQQHIRSGSLYTSAVANASNRQKRESPIIVPSVIRPGQNNMQGQNGKTGGTPQSVVSRASYASPYDNTQVLGKNTKFAPVNGINSGRICHNKAQQHNPQHGNGIPQPSSGMFATPNKNGAECGGKDVQDAFRNLFRAPGNDNMMGGLMQTPSFFEPKHRFKAEPVNATK